MSSKYTAAQKKAYAIKMAKKRSGTSKKDYSKGKISGYGAYRKNYGKELGSLIGEGIQEGLSQLMAAGVGPLGAAKMISGFGEYYPHNVKVKSNVLDEGNSPPVIKNGSDASFVMRHSEFVADVITHGPGFEVASYPINPGLEGTFPWLAPIAQQFEQYRIEGMVFEFKSNFGEVSTSGPLGTVIMATDYNSTDSTFRSKLEMENSQYAASTKPSHSMVHPIECAKLKTPITELYVRGGELQNNEDPRLYDLGNFQIATQGIPGTYPGNQTIGQLYCHYQIRLFKPKMAGISNITYSAFYENLSGISTANPFGSISTLTESKYNTLDLRLEADGTVYFPKGITSGHYLVSVVFVYGSNAVCTTISLGNFVNCDVWAWEDPFGVAFYAPTIGDTSSRKSRTWCLTIPEPTANDAPVSFKLSTTLPASMNLVKFFVTSMDNVTAYQIPYQQPPPPLLTLKSNVEEVAERESLLSEEKTPVVDEKIESRVKIINDYLSTNPSQEALAKFMEMLRKDNK
nr:MAG: putative capsid protein [Arizlama virus]